MELESPGSPFRLSRGLVIGIGVAIVALVAAATLVLMNPDPTGTGGGGTPQATIPTQPALKQARWHLAKRIVGPRGGAKGTVLKLQAAAAGDVVKQFYDALLIEPGSFDTVAGEHVSPAAARALAGSGIATGKDLDRLQTLRRAAAVSLEAPNGARAAATVRIKLRGFAGEKRVFLQHSSTLWLERTGKKWQVIAFEADQRRKR
jgi:hypothetical protein